MLALQVKTSRSFKRDGNRLLHRHTLNELSEGGDNKARGAAFVYPQVGFRHNDCDFAALV